MVVVEVLHVMKEDMVVVMVEMHRMEEVEVEVVVVELLQLMTEDMVVVVVVVVVEVGVVGP